MISDVLFEARVNMQSYLDDPATATSYQGAMLERIKALMNEMALIQRDLDLPPGTGRFEFSLRDPLNDFRQTPAWVEAGSSGLAIHVNGYSTKTESDETGTIALLEMYNEELQLHVWSDINREDPLTMRLYRAAITERDDDDA